MNKDKIITESSDNKPRYIKFGILEDESRNIEHCFTTRELDFKGDNLKEKAEKTLKPLAESFGIKIKAVRFADQVHGTNIKIISDKSREDIIIKEQEEQGYDALITNKKGVLLVTFHADCLPVYLYDCINHAIGLVHSGWKGTLNEISAKTIDAMNAKFGTKPCDIKAVIGPGIDRCCFEVDNDVYGLFKNRFPNLKDIFEKKKYGKWNIDLFKIAENTLLKNGVLEERILCSKICTACRNDMFFSHRKEKGKEGRMAALFVLKQNNT